MTGEPAALPGPGLDVPVDADGDGVSTYGDRYAFNYWLGLGGDLASAISTAEVGKDGVIDVSKFFSSSAAELVPRSKVLEAEPVQESAAGGGAALTGSCATTASIVAPFGAPTPPASLFMTCQYDLRYPTGADMDRLQGLWCSRGRQVDNPGQDGVVLLDLSQVPPMENDGSMGVGPSGITTSGGFGAEDIVVRESPLFKDCPTDTMYPPSTIHAMSTWEITTNPTPSGSLICPTLRNTVGALCGSCKLVDTPAPFAIDAVRPCPPQPAPCPQLDFGNPEDVIFSDKEAGVVRIRRLITPGTSPPPGCYDQPHTLTTLATLTGVAKVWGLALGDFKGAGVFGAYFVSESTNGARRVQRLVWDAQTSAFMVDSHFTVLLPPILQSNNARSIAFDPISGALFVSEDQAYNQNGQQARIWRIPVIPVSATGTFVATLFGKNFNKPNGIAFHPSGVMLVAEESFAEPDKGNVLAVGGWRNLFKRGDANGSGIVDISDPIVIANWVNHVGPVPACLDGADANDDSKVNAADPPIILDYLFSGGPAPPPPGPNTCGRDPTPDLLDCTLSLGAGCAIQ